MLRKFLKPLNTFVLPNCRALQMCLNPAATECTHWCLCSVPADLPVSFIFALVVVVAGYDYGKPVATGCRTTNSTTGQALPIDQSPVSQIAVWSPGIVADISHPTFTIFVLLFSPGAAAAADGNSETPVLYRLLNNCSIYTAECMRFFLALKLIYQSRTKSFLVLSDS